MFISPRQMSIPSFRRMFYKGMPKAKLFLGFLGFCIVVIILVQVAKTIDKRVKNMQSEPKKIMLWNFVFTAKSRYIPDSQLNTSYFQYRGCSITNCKIINNNSQNTTNADAVVFHTAQDTSITHHPLTRDTNQLYVFYNVESPDNTRRDFSSEQNFYNLTMSFQLDADILWTYGKIVDLATNEVVAPHKSPSWRKPTEQFELSENLKTIISGKNKSIAWFVSNCHPPSRREVLVRALQKYIPVDIYGRCGSLKCVRFSGECDLKLDYEYKFYLSFENSLCTDYVTEKFFNMLNRTIVPVVFGGADYSKFAPPESYINAQDYRSAKDLADYLIYLDKNPREYEKYFWWKKFYRVDFIWAYCDLCARLNTVPLRGGHYDDIKQWWHGHKCFKPKIKF